MNPLLLNAYGIRMAILVAVLSVGRIQADPNAEKVIRDFFVALAARDTNSLKPILGERVGVISAGRMRANVGFDEAKDASGLLPPEGKNLSPFEISSVKIDVSPTHGSVSVASFTLEVRFSNQQLAGFETELKQNPSNAELRKLFADGGMKASMFAMLARELDGSWKIVCISLPS